MAEATPPAPDSELEASLLEEALANLGAGPWSVLDLGPARPATLAFFRQFRCRVGFADALDVLADLGRRGPVAASPLPDELREAVPVYPERPWHLVLLWDLLDYLPGDLLEALMARLDGALAPDARFHGFLSPGADPVPARPAVYDILTRTRLRRQVDTSAGTAAATRHTPWHLQRHMPGIELDRSRLRRDGRQEHLLRYAGAAARKREPGDARSGVSEPQMNTDKHR